MLSSCSNYISSNPNSQSDDYLSLFSSETNDDLFLIKSTISPSKYRILNTPERV